MFLHEFIKIVICQVMHMTRDIRPLRLRGWRWWTLTGILHELHEILSLPAPHVLKVFLAIVEVSESWIPETDDDNICWFILNGFPKQLKVVARIKQIPPL